MSMRIHCPNPQCPDPDHVVKVSAAQAAGNATGYAGGTGTAWVGGQSVTVNTGGRTHSQTDLSRRLTVPKPGALSWGRVLIGVPLVLSTFSCCIASMLPGGFLRYQLTDAPVSDLFGVIGQQVTPFVLIVLPFLVLGIALRWLGKRTSNKRYTTWWKLYYCPTCDSVFNPGGGWTHSARMMDLIR